MEFAYVMEIARKMCNTIYVCKYCPANGNCVFHSSEYNKINYKRFEEVAIGWEKGFDIRIGLPTWRMWFAENFPQLILEECLDSPIPPDVATKLGVKPKGEQI